VLSFIINTNILIAFAAVSLSLATQVQLGMKPHLHIYLAVIFFATIFDYTFHRIIAVINNPESLHIEKYVWAANHLKLLKIMMALSLTGLVVTLFFVKVEIVYLLVPLALLTFLYSVPIFKNGDIRFRLQEITGLKIILIALVWSCVTVIVPALQSGNGLDPNQILLVFVERFTFILAIAIPFDIRDMKADALSGIKTIPLALGENRALLICYFALVTSLLIAIMHYQLNHMAFIIPAYSVSIAITYLLINSKKLRNVPFFYHGLLDGSIILHGILIIFSCFILA
jgi:4-hydroxybenzoate polyprenyltransferase